MSVNKTYIIIGVLVLALLSTILITCNKPTKEDYKKELMLQQKEALAKEQVYYLDSLSKQKHRADSLQKRIIKLESEALERQKNIAKIRVKRKVSVEKLTTLNETEQLAEFYKNVGDSTQKIVFCDSTPSKSILNTINTAFTERDSYKEEVDSLTNQVGTLVNITKEQKNVVAEKDSSISSLTSLYHNQVKQTEIEFGLREKEESKNKKAKTLRIVENIVYPIIAATIGFGAGYGVAKIIK